MNAVDGMNGVAVVVHKDQKEVHSMMGNHIAGVATPGKQARQVEMWQGSMDTGAATPPHVHDTEEVVMFLTGRGHATVSGQEVRFEAGDTLILPAGEMHQIFAEAHCEFVSAMPIGGTVRLPDGETLELPWRA